MSGENYLKQAKSENGTLTVGEHLPARDFLRRYMLYSVGYNNIFVKGVKLRNSPKFVFYPTRFTNLTINSINVYNDWWAQNGDGIDISAFKNVVIYNTTFSVGDEGICMKSSGKNADPNDGNLQNILIAVCTV